MRGVPHRRNGRAWASAAVTGGWLLCLLGTCAGAQQVFEMTPNGAWSRIPASVRMPSTGARAWSASESRSPTAIPARRTTTSTTRPSLGTAMGSSPSSERTGRGSADSPTVPSRPPSARPPGYPDSSFRPTSHVEPPRLPGRCHVTRSHGTILAHSVGVVYHGDDLAAQAWDGREQCIVCWPH